MSINIHHKISMPFPPDKWIGGQFRLKVVQSTKELCVKSDRKLKQMTRPAFHPAMVIPLYFNGKTRTPGVDMNVHLRVKCQRSLPRDDIPSTFSKILEVAVLVPSKSPAPGQALFRRVPLQQGHTSKEEYFVEHRFIC